MESSLNVLVKSKIIEIKRWRQEKMEQCKNPWKDACKSENIKLYIVFKGETRPICSQCWSRIADQEYEWC